MISEFDNESQNTHNISISTLSSGLANSTNKLNSFYFDADDKVELNHTKKKIKKVIGIKKPETFPIETLSFMPNNCTETSDTKDFNDYFNLSNNNNGQSKSFFNSDINTKSTASLFFEQNNLASFNTDFDFDTEATNTFTKTQETIFDKIKNSEGATSKFLNTTSNPFEVTYKTGNYTLKKNTLKNPFNNDNHDFFKPPKIKMGGSKKSGIYNKNITDYTEKMKNLWTDPFKNCNS